MDNIVACGPFIGSFESEVIQFQPFVKWLYLVLKPQKFFISSHKNRKFLYPDNTIFLPVYEDLTRNEFSQDYIVHKDVGTKDYNIIVKKFRQDVSSHIKGNNVLYYRLTYNRFSWIPEYKRVFEPLKLKSNKKSHIIFIPSDVEKSQILYKIYEKLSNLNDFVCIGDMKTYLPEHNILLRDNLYFQNVYKNMFDYICNAKCVICPSSYWTTICSFYNIPCFSWGKYTGPDIESKNIHIINNNDTSVEHIILGVKAWLKEMRLLN